MATRPEIPTLGLGTYRNDDPDRCAESVRTALAAGYRHVDTAEAYGNEEAVGNGVATSEVSREDVVLATKVLHPKFTDDYSTEGIVESGRGCLDRLDVDSVELFYGVHWPGGDYDPEDTFAACARLHEEGAFDRLGVCNMTPELVDEARETSDVPVSAVQAEMHPLLQQEALREYCDRHGMDLVAYAPLGNGRVFEVPELREIGEKHGVSEAQVSLAWLREKGVAAIPKATGGEHIRDNWGSRDLELDDGDVDRIDSIDREERQYDNPYAPDW
ncbi:MULTISPECIES: aldo/keto reductase [Halorussus]|uniref:aldo/keto reductase n=1 Tax=Halorussus TaxID=1070314 RepID=UPI000E2191A8|nr:MULTISPECIES: aldo/keto reductase [Halorussus]NHN57920.1 aldo/keto reductase [Halorussus sp. JP-T4]